MAFLDFFKKTETPINNENSDLRMDAISHEYLNINNGRDKISAVRPADASDIIPNVARRWQKTMGVLSKVINAPAEDATKNGFCVKTGDQLIDRKIENRLFELDMQNKLKEALKYRALHAQGSVLYPVLEADIPQDVSQLNNQIPAKINRIASINVLEPDYFKAYWIGINPLSSLYNIPEFRIYGTIIHPSRYHWFIKDFNRSMQTGKSVLEDVFDAVKANEIGLWSVTHALAELSLKIMKTPAVAKSNPSTVIAFAQRLRDMLSTNSATVIDSTEEITKLNSSFGGLKEIFDFIVDNISMLSEIPQARLKGAAHGVLASGDYDMLAYYEKIERLQKNELYIPISKIVDLIIIEQNLPVKDYEIEFKPLWKMSPADEMELELKRSQRDKLDIESGKISPQEARQLDPRLVMLESLDTGEGA